MKIVSTSILNALNGLIEEAKSTGPNMPKAVASHTVAKVFDPTEMERLMDSLGDVPLKAVTGVDILDVSKARECEDSNSECRGSQTDVDEIMDGDSDEEEAKAEQAAYSSMSSIG